MSDLDELHQDYQNAVDCVARCEFTIESLREQLIAKDKTHKEQLTLKDMAIANLEEKIVLMSLELASSKAFEDEHRAKRRIKNVGINASSGDDNDDGALCPSSPPGANIKLMERATSVPVVGDVEDSQLAGGPAAPCRSELCAGETGGSQDSISNRVHSFDFGQLFRKSKEDECPEGLQNESWSVADDNVTPNRLANFRKLFGMNQNRREQNKGLALREDFPKVDNERRRRDGMNDNGEQPPLRRSSRQRRISGVIFPVTFEDCLQGCGVDTSINKGLKNPSKKEWEEFENGAAV
mmetsp:Transcript_3712/g.8123  ORF Transcript_3712/g.8123 Transcript_3712/m.8123 type:complete len:295 (+) Transcript_3712:162-1046(+)